MNKLKSFLIWGVVVLLGLAAFTTLAIHRGEQVSAVWMVIAAVSVYAIAYRFYSLYIAKNVMQLDPNRLTPATVPSSCFTMSPKDLPSRRMDTNNTIAS